MPEPDIAIPERAQWALFSFPRFTAPQSLRDMAAKGETFYGNYKAAQKAAA